MIETLVCNCLNVNIHGDIKAASPEELNYMRNMIDSISDQSRGEISPFFSNSRLVRLNVDDIKEVMNDGRGHQCTPFPLTFRFT